MIDVKDLLLEELIEELGRLNIEKFRAKQILDWVYKKCVSDFDRMANLPQALRESLKEKFYISELKVGARRAVPLQISKDGTRKFLFELEDGEKIETVFIPSKNTNTVCVSSQVGCRFACKFCTSGKAGLVRNLRPAEMVNQVMYVRENVTNVVFMGIGEPLDNYDNVLKAVRILNAPYGLAVGQRKITLSTCGVIPGIKRLMKEGLQIELSVSLHSPDDRVRSRIMVVNKRYPIKELMAALKEYIRKTNRQVTLEYVLIKGINDSAKDAQALAVLLKGMLAKVNLIRFNAPHPNPLPKGERELSGSFPKGERELSRSFPRGEREYNFSLSPERGEGRACPERSRRGEGEGYAAPDAKVIRGFKNILDENGVVSTIRASRGQDIEAACGQLRLKKKNKDR